MHSESMMFLSAGLCCTSLHGSLARNTSYTVQLQCSQVQSSAQTVQLHCSLSQSTAHTVQLHCSLDQNTQHTLYSFTTAWVRTHNTNAVQCHCSLVENTQHTLYSFTAAWLRTQHTDAAYAVVSAGVDGVMPKTFQLRIKTIVFVTCGFLKPHKFSTLIETAPLTDLVLPYCHFLAWIKIVFF